MRLGAQVHTRVFYRGNESHIPRLLPFGKHKETTIAPPAATAAPGDSVAVNTPAATTTPAAPPKKKKHSFFHDVLGL